MPRGRATPAIAVALPLILASGCATGRFRDVDLDANLSQFDLVYFRTEAEVRVPGHPIQSSFTPVPPLLPIIYLSESQSFAHGQPLQVRIEKAWMVVLGFVARRRWTEYGDDGVIAATGARFKLLWGLFGTEHGPAGRKWQLFWIPFG